MRSKQRVLENVPSPGRRVKSQHPSPKLPVIPESRRQRRPPYGARGLSPTERAQLGPTPFRFMSRARASLKSRLAEYPYRVCCVADVENITRLSPRAVSVSANMPATLRKTVITVAILNLAYFGIEFVVAFWIGSVSLFADSVDFLEDTSLNILVAVGLGWSAVSRARLGMVLAGILLIPGLATVWTAWHKFVSPLPPRPCR